MNAPSFLDAAMRDARQTAPRTRTADRRRTAVLLGLTFVTVAAAGPADAGAATKCKSPQLYKPEQGYALIINDMRVSIVTCGAALKVAGKHLEAKTSMG